MLRAEITVAGASAAKTNKLHTRIHTKSKRKLMKFANERRLILRVENGCGFEKHFISV
jgi:hypothetical protein